MGEKRDLLYIVATFHLPHVKDAESLNTHFIQCDLVSDKDNDLAVLVLQD